MAIDEELDLPRPFGPYTLVRRLAVGGMAEVYVAKTKGLGGFEKHVAIKVIHPRYSEDEHFVQMLVEEAKISVLLTHVNIAQTFDLGCIDDTYYIVMELIEGADAYRIMRKTAEMKRAMPIDLCVHIAAEMCNGLDYAHRKRDADGKPLGIVHRDISPQNVLISFAGEVKIVDFGIAKAALRSGQTEAGVIKGKYYYMSPEQAWGDPMDHRSDIFSVGVVLYELLTGRMLYQEDNVPLLLDKVRKVDVQRPETRRPSIPRELSDIVMKALSKEPADRYQSAQEMAQALQQFLHRSSPTFTSARLAELMGTLFPNEVQRHSAIMKLPSVEEPLERETRAARVPDARGGSGSSFELGDDDDEDDATRNDILPFRKGQRAKARAPEPEAPPSARPTLRPPRARSTDRTTDRIVAAPVVGPSGAWVSPIADSETTSPLRAPEEPTDDSQAAPEWDDPTHLKGDQWEDDATLVDAGELAAALRVAAPQLAGARAKGERGKVNVHWAGKAPPGAASPAAASPPGAVPPPRVPGPGPVAGARGAAGAPPSPAAAAQEPVAPNGTPGAVVPPPVSAVAGAPPVPPPAVQAPAVQAPAVQAPAVQASARQAPAMQAPAMQARAVPAPAIPGTPSPSVAPPRPPWEAPAPAAPTPWSPVVHGAFPTAHPGVDPFAPAPQPGADPFAPPPPQPAGGDAPAAPSGRRLVAIIAGAVFLVGLAVLALVALVGTRPPPAIEVISSPTGASVAIDGRALPGVTPLLVEEGIESGRTYRVDVTMPGYQPWSAQLSPTDGPLRQFVVLAPLPATLRVETEPVGAAVMVNGVERGQSPVELPGLQVGQEVEVRVLVPGRAPVIRRVRLGEGTTVERVLVAGP